MRTNVGVTIRVNAYFQFGGGIRYTISLILGTPTMGKEKKKSLPGFHSGSFVGSDPNIVPQNNTFIPLSLLLFLELGSLLKFRAFILGNVTFKVSNAIHFAICKRPSGFEVIKFKLKNAHLG